MTEKFKKGDKVVWSSHGSDDTPGVVERKITSDTTAAGREVVEGQHRVHSRVSAASS